MGIASSLCVLGILSLPGPALLPLRHNLPQRIQKNIVLLRLLQTDAVIAPVQAAEIPAAPD